MSRELSEQEIVRRNALQEIRDLGFEPYPADLYEVNTSAKEIKDKYDENDENSFKQVSIAGRLMSRRVMGKASFAEIQDSSGRIQIYVSRDDICPDEDKTLYNKVFKKLLASGFFCLKMLVISLCKRFIPTNKS